MSKQTNLLSSWYKKFHDWLEYSPSKDAAFCLVCYLFADKPNTHTNVFTATGFSKWKRVNDGEKCAFITHIGVGPCSAHNNSMRSKIDLLNDRGHIRHAFVIQEEEKIYYALSSQLMWYNDEVSKAIESGANNAQYIAPLIQKEILHVIATKVRNHIRAEIHDSKFCIIVDEARDEAKREQMALVLRFVDRESLIKERFLQLIHVKDTSAKTLKTELSSVLKDHNLLVQNIRGQGYDGASNMRGQWNGLQALFLADCPYAYYIHCFAYRLQLALVAASRDVPIIYQYFSNLNIIGNLIGASPKRHDELQASKVVEIETLLSSGQLETAKGANQIGTLKRAEDTRWGSHLQSIRSLLNMFDATISVLEHIKADKSCTSQQRGDADNGLNLMNSYDFVFVSHLMRELLGISDILCQSLQKKSQDIVNAVKIVSTTKSLIPTFREDHWDVQNMTFQYLIWKFSTIDKQAHELDYRFNERALELLTLASLLEPSNGYKNLVYDLISTLAVKYYSSDFTSQEQIQLKYQLQHFICEAQGNDFKLKNTSTLQDLCQYLEETRMSDVFYLFDRLIRLVLTLSVSTATTERAFSAMKIMKTRLRNKMEDDFLADSLVIYIEREISKSFSIESIVDDFKSLKDRRVLFDV